MSTSDKPITWHKVLDSADQLPEGRVISVTAGHTNICLTHYQDKFCGLDNRCPHQGGPLGEGSIENGLLRCPWHGWDFDPHTGQSPGAHDDSIVTFPVEEREDGIFVGVPEEESRQPTVADVMVETMIQWGVDTVFGMVGHSNLGLADAFRRQEAKGNLKYYGIRHEGAGAFAASAYAKLTGKPAVCFAIAGPGGTNMYTGLWDAKVDRVPILALTGQVDTQVVGTGAFQEVDLKAAFETVAEFNHTVQTGSKHSELMALAVKTALVKRDVSHLTFPDEVQVQPVADYENISGPEGRITGFEISPPKESLEKAVDLFKKSKKPVIIVGHGARFHMKQIIGFAESLNAPILTTFKGKGLVPDSHPLGCGVLGRSGTPIASWFMNEADLLCVFGASFSNHTGITPKIPTIQVDFDPQALSKFHPLECAVWGEIGVSVELLAQSLKGETNTEDQRNQVQARWEIWKKEKAKRLQDDRGQGVSSIAVFEAMNRQVPENAVIAVDVGNNTYSFGRYFETSHQSILMSGYLGSIGFGFPAAMGAWAAAPNRPIFAVAGDGGFTQYLGEFTTAVKYQMPIRLVLLNNSELGKISKEQRSGEFDVWKTSLKNPNYAEFANNCGGFGIRVTEKSQLDQALQAAMNQDGPAIVEVITDVTLI